MALKKMEVWFVVAGAMVLFLAACGGGQSVGDTRGDAQGLTDGNFRIPDPDGRAFGDAKINPPPDKPQAAGLIVDEADMRLQLSGQGATKQTTLSLAVRRSTAVGAVDGVASATLECKNPSILSAPVSFTQEPFHLAADVELAEVKLGPAPYDSESEEHWPGYMASCIIHWRVDVGAASLEGRRSAWAALLHLEVELTAPPATNADGESYARVRVTRLETGEPVAGSLVALDAPPWSYSEPLWECTTDSTGICSGTFPGWAGALVALVRRGHLITDVWMPMEQSGEGAPRLLLTTDKPLYQPGQTVHMRVMALASPDNAPVEASEAVFLVVDAKGNKLARIIEQTNSYGIASARFKLGSHLNLGPYTVVAEVVGVEAARTVKVSRYTLPKFKVSVSLAQDFYMAGETIEGAVYARYLFGKPVAGGTVEIATLAADGESAGPFAISGKTDGDGYFDFAAQLPANIDEYLEGGDGGLYFAIKVTDGADQDQESTLAVPLTTAPVRVFLVPEGEPLIAGLEHLFYLVTTDPTGKLVKTTNQVSFDNDPGVAVESDPQGIAVVSHVVGADAVKVTVASDDGKHQAEATFQFPVVPEGSGVAVRTDKAVYVVGEVMEISVLAAPEGSTVLLDLAREGQIVDMQAALGDGLPVLFSVPVGQGWDGELQATVTVLADNAPARQAHRAAFVHRHKELAVAISTDKELYGPAETLKLSFAVTDEAGQPRQGAIGLTVVDEALYAIQDVKPGLLWRFFEVGGHLAEPIWKYQFPKVDVVGLLGQALPAAEDALQHFQLQAAATLAAVESLNLATATAFAGDKQTNVAVMVSRSLVQAQVDEFANLAIDKWSTGTWASHQVVENLVAASWSDPWGNSYVVKGELDWARFDSAGMDEEWETADDVSGIPDLCEVFDSCWEEWDSSCCPDAVGWELMEQDVVGGWGDTTEPGEPPEGGKPVKVRRWFPETLYVDPAVITDAQGKASVDIPLADSITQWRVTGLANAVSGRLGTVVHGVTVFQDFFVDPDLPATYTRGDEVTFPVAVYNYLDKAQAVTVSLEPGSWYTALGPLDQSITVPADSVDAVHFSIKLTKAGLHLLTVTAVGPDAQDAIARKVRVEPGGRPVTVSHSGSTASGGQGTLWIPGDTIEGSARAVLKFYGTGIVQVLEGVDSLLHYPDG
jgi:alpha-2-macroglobulin-like protein